VPSLKPFKDDVLHIGGALVVIATETEVIAERALLDSTRRYYRFNVVRKVQELAAATRWYTSSQEVHKPMQACAGNIAGLVLP
jgi:hypothetical protein